MSNRTISFSNLLILLAFLVTIFSFVSPQILIYGMSNIFIARQDYLNFWIQFLLYQFLHGGVLHLLSNSFFLYLFGNQMEVLMKEKRYIIFFLLNTVFVGLSLLFFSNGNTIGISGFAMAILAYMFLELKSRNHPEYRSAGLFLFINVAIGFTGNISLIGHLSGAIFGMLFYVIVKKVR